MAELFRLPFVQALDSDGNPISGATLTFYLTGTSTLATIYSDNALATPLANPITADSAGRFAPIYLDPAVTYRAVLKSAGGTTINDADPLNLSDGSGVSVVRLGAIGDGVADDTAAIIAADAAAVANGSRVVFFPPGNYRVTAQLTVSDFVEWRGADYLANPSNGAPDTLMTTISVDWGANPADPLAWTNVAVLVGYSSAIRGITFNYPGQVAQSAATPIPYGFTVSTKAGNPISDNLTIENCSFYNSYNGLRLNNVGGGKINRINGNPLNIGFQADSCFDVMEVANVEFWPYYAQPGSNLAAWVQANGTAFNLFRIDGLTAIGCFVYGYNIGFHCRDSLWADFIAPKTDTCNYSVIVQSAAHVTFDSFTFISTSLSLPAVWCRAAVSARFGDGRVTATAAIGMQIDDLATGIYQIDNCNFESAHFAAVVTSASCQVRFSNCAWSKPPQGGSNVFVDGSPLAASDTAITLPSTYTTTNVTPSSGVYTFDLSTLGDKIVSWDFTSIGQRNSLFVLECDYELIGASATWYLQIFLAQDTGANVMVNYSALAPVILNGTTGAPKRLRLQIPENGVRFRQVLTVKAVPTVAVSGASLKLSNFALYEQANTKTTDAQVSMMMRRGYNNDGYSIGQTLYARGDKRLVRPLIDAGIGRTTEVPTTGTWAVGDVVEVINPASAGYIGYVCTVAGTPGTWRGFGLIA